jgi:hypothetical protein
MKKQKIKTRSFKKVCKFIDDVMLAKNRKAVIQSRPRHCRQPHKAP